MTDWNKERMQSGIRVKDALNVTSDFLEWYLDFLKEHQPGATNTMRDIEHAIGLLPVDIEELDEDAEATT